MVPFFNFGFLAQWPLLTFKLNIQSHELAVNSLKHYHFTKKWPIIKFPPLTNMLVLAMSVLFFNVSLIAFCFLVHRDHLESYTSDYTAQVLVGYCMVYIFMQTFMIPGTVFMSLLAGALFGVFKGVALVVFAATAGASSCFFFSKLIGRPLLFSLWPDKLEFFQAQVNITLLVAIFGFNNHQI